MGHLRLIWVARLRRVSASGVAAWLGLIGCAPVKTYLDEHVPLPRTDPYVGVEQPARPRAERVGARQPISPTGPVVPAEAEVPAAPAADVPVEVDELVRYAVGQNPRLARATFAIDAAKGRYIQAGLYPNPDLAINWDEIGDRTGPGGILNVPRFTQQIVTGRKLSLSQAVAATEVNQATLSLMTERYAVVGSVRAAFYDLYSLERRAAILDDLVKLAGEAVKTGQNLLDNKQIARLDLIQLEAERERFRAEAESLRQEIPAARKKLAAAMGAPRLPLGPVTGPFDEVPQYDLDQTLDAVLATHPEVRTARVGVELAQATIRRAEVEPIPNVTFTTGFIRQYENRSNDFALGLSAPVPVWNRNQGNILAAKANLGVAIQEVGRVENDLAERVATAQRTYSAALARARRYQTEIIPRTEEAYKLSLAAFKGGQFEYLRVLQAQRSVGEGRLEYNRSLGEAWRAAAELSGLLLQEVWPGRPDRGPGAEPAKMPLPEPPPDDTVKPRSP